MFNSYICSFFFQGEDILDEEFDINLENYLKNMFKFKFV